MFGFMQVVIDSQRIGPRVVCKLARHGACRAAGKPGDYAAGPKGGLFHFFGHH
jgi:hypothetical protein